MNDTAEAQVVTADAQLTMGRLLRPQQNWQTIYQGFADGQTAPIYFFPRRGPNLDGAVLDQLAGQVGYSARLVNGYPIPRGSRFELWLPSLTYTDDDVTYAYSWRVVWRRRTVLSFRQDRKPYSIPGSVGVADSTPTTGGARVLLPACEMTINYAEPEPTSPTVPDSLRGTVSVRGVDIQASRLPLLRNPMLTTSVEGVIQQGVLDPVVVETANRPTYLYFDGRAAGDELLLCIYRPQTAGNWDFTDVTGLDRSLAAFFNASANLGPIVAHGTASP